MKLLKCHIENFGKLSNFDYVFKSGLNTIKEENGFGKTTFASFIKSMFYGMDSKRNTKQLIDRKKYEPWQGGAFGGNIEFQLNNKKYKLERFFGKKENEDIFKLYNLETNLECTDFLQNIGEEIFKLNKEAYERSTFISGQNVETSINDSISAKLGNVLESENDVNTSKKAFEILDEAIKTYKKTGGRGELNEKMLRKTMIEKDLEKSKIDEISYLQRKKQNDEINKKIKEKELEKETLQKKIKLQIEEDTKKAKMEYYNNINNNYEQSKRLYEEYENKLQEKSEIESKIELNANDLKNIASKIENFESSIKANKNIVFYTTDAESIADNVIPYFSRLYQARYLSGIIAGMETKSGKIGYVAAMDNSEVNRGINAFALGVQRVNKDAVVIVKRTGSWENKSEEVAAADKLIDAGADVLTCHQNRGYSIEEADRKGIYTIGYHSTPEDVSDKMLTSIECDWSAIYSIILSEYCKGTSGRQSHYWIGIEDGAVSLSSYSDDVTDDMKTEVAKAKDEITGGRDVFSGVIFDNKGELRCMRGETMTDDNILNNVDWLVKGVQLYEE